MHLKLFVRFILLTVGFALTTLGLLGWQQTDFDLSRMWPLGDTFDLHPVHLMVLGMALIPPTAWEIFVLEMNSTATRQPTKRTQNKETQAARE